MNKLYKTKVVYSENLSDRDFEEIEMKGYLRIARAVLPSGKQYPVYFYDPGRIEGDLSLLSNIADNKKKFIAHPGLIVIPKVNKNNIENTVEKLYEQGYFDCLRPLTGELLIEDDISVEVEPREKARYAFNLILNTYLKSKNFSLVDSMIDGTSWLITLVNGIKLVIMKNFYSVESLEGNSSSFEVNFDPERGGVIAVKFLPDLGSAGYDILIPNEQIANIEKE